MPASSLLAGSYSCRPQNACQLSELIMNKTSQEKKTRPAEAPSTAFNEGLIYSYEQLT